MINRNRFSNILKKTGVILSLACVIFVSAGCSGTQTSNTNGSIEMNDSIEIALSASGLTRDQVSDLHVEYDEDDGTNGEPVYNVTFDADGSEYDYMIQASNGSIITFDVSKDDSPDDDDEYVDNEDNLDDGGENTDASDNVQNGDSSENTSADSNYIGVDKAKEIALKHAEVNESQVTFVKAKLSYDDGQHEYELEFYSDTMEYDYEIDAHSGKILDWDHDNFEEDWDD